MSLNIVFLEPPAGLRCSPELGQSHYSPCEVRISPNTLQPEEVTYLWQSEIDIVYPSFVFHMQFLETVFPEDFAVSKPFRACVELFCRK